MVWDRQISIKSNEEIAVMRKAGEINAEALAAAKAAIRPGVTTKAINEAAEAVLEHYGVYSPFKNYPGPFPYPASTTVSVNDELVHGIPGSRRVNEGDIVSIDCGTVFEGFVADSAITVGVGELSRRNAPFAESYRKITLSWYRTDDRPVIGLVMFRPQFSNTWKVKDCL